MSSHKRTHPDIPSETPGRTSPVKRARTDSNHDPSCNDTACPGCAAGELEIDFGSEAPKSASELYREALDERDNGRGVPLSPDESRDSDAEDQEAIFAKRRKVTGLFEMAVSAFEAELEAHEAKGMAAAGSSSASGSSRHPPASSLETRIMFASLLVDFGVYLPLRSMIDRGVDMYLSCVAEAEAEGSGAMAPVFVGLGRARMESLIVKCRGEDKVLDDVEEDSGDEEDAREREDEKAALKSAVEEARRGLSFVEGEKEKYARECLLLATLFKDYAAFQRRRERRKRSPDTLLLSLDTALSLISAAAAAHPEALEENPLNVGMWGSCLFHLADHRKNIERDEARELARDANEKLRVAAARAATTTTGSQVDTPSLVEILHSRAQTCMLLSTIEETSEAALAAFEEAERILKEAGDLDPDNEEIQAQLDTIAELNEEENMVGGSGDYDSDDDSWEDEHEEEEDDE
ncbi:hypothetical protein HK104_009167 [Borealophlyctis nickersoniae]|nr:hypothetical protein HK104_009167 [Borealophlyctis nickersoniae]